MTVPDSDFPPHGDGAISVSAFDSLSPVAAGAVLPAVCGSLAWVVALVATRPHRTLEMLRTRSDEAIAALEWSDIEQALDADSEMRAEDAAAGDDAEDGGNARRAAVARVARRRLGTAFVDVDPPAVAPMWISLDGAENVRDVGGMPLVDGGVVRPGALLRSDSLQQLSASDVRRLIDDFGVTAIADLRTGIEVDGEGPGPMTREPGVVLVHLSLFPEVGRQTDVAVTASGDGPAILPWQRRDGGDGPQRGTPEVYLSYLEDRSDSVVDALRLIAHTPGATIVHCAAGKDRTGTVVALALSEVGVDRAAIVADYARSAERVERVLRRLVRRPVYTHDVSATLADLEPHKPRARTMQDLLGALDAQHGGVGAWLRDRGWTEQDAQALRRKLRG